MKWERASAIHRLFFGFFGIFGVLGAVLLLSNWDIVEKQPTDTKIYLLGAAAGLVLCLWIAIVGRVPDFRSIEENRDKK
jgi:hypothetical protein